MGSNPSYLLKSFLLQKDLNIQPNPTLEALDEALIVGILGLYIWQPCSVARDDLLAKPPKVIMMDHYEKNRLFCG